MAILIKNGTLVTPEGLEKGDLLIDGETIAAMGPDISAPNAQVIDATDQMVLPGGLDAHTHFELPNPTGDSADDFYSGGCSALAGGTTTVIDFIAPDRGESLLKARERWVPKTEKASVDYSFHMNMPEFNARVAEEMKILAQREGVSSFKTFTAYWPTLGIRDYDILNILKVSGEVGGLVTMHAENGDIVEALQREFIAQGKTAPKYHPLTRPPFVEGEAVARGLALAKAAHQPLYIVHISTKDGLEALTRARMDGQVVYGETCPQYLALDDSCYDAPGFEAAAFVMSPPPRPKGHQEALLNGLSAGLIDTCATDHCPYRMDTQKIAGINNFTKIPNGAPTIEHRLGILHTLGIATGKMTWTRLVDAWATAPAKIFDLYPKKGVLKVGSDADICVFDPRQTEILSVKTHHSRNDRCVFEGFEQKGKTTLTIQRGRIAWRNGELTAQRGFGRFLPRCK